MVQYQPPKDWQQWVEWLAAGLHGRSRWRLSLILLGMVFARGRRTVTTWLRAVGIRDDFADYYYFLQPLDQIHLHSSLDGEVEPNSSASFVYLISVVALIILLITIINYVNLSISKFGTRAKEAGIRKTLGATHREIKLLIFGESFFICLVSLAVSCVLLIVGWGPFPAMGIMGAALAALAAYAVGATVLVVHLVSRHALVRLQFRTIRFRRDEAIAILGVGALSAASATLFQITTFFVAGLISVLGSSAVAAYGAANRLEMLQYPITFAFGSAVITMVATAAGARDFERARRVAWTGAAVAGAIGLIFSAVALFGGHWMGLFTADPAIREVGALYLLCQAAVFPFTGAGLACYFACLGIGYVSGPFLLAALRLVLIVGGCWLALSLTGNAMAAFAAIALGIAFFGASLLIMMRAKLRQIGGR